VPRLMILLTLLCAAAAPPTYVVSEAESAKLDKGQVVVRHEPAENGGGVVAFVDIPAPTNVVLDAVMDLAARVEENGAITGLDIYLTEPSPERIGAEWTLSVIGTKVVFNLIYECHRTQGFCTYWLDESRKNDIVSSTGHYVVLPHGAGTRLIYASNTDTGRSMPGFIRRWIAGSSLNTQVEGIRKRATPR
jgi:hypothetical protein